jgi:alpha-mannosidase
VVFPLARPIDHALFDGAYEIVRRPTRLPPGGDEWIEQPAAEQPMRCFVGAEVESGGLLIANHGLREASVSPEGEIAVTLLRAYGWLSQDDLATRKGGAGPKVETPGGQVPGKHRFSLSVVPIRGSLGRAIAEAYSFQSEMRAVGTRRHAGRLPGAASFIDVTGDGFELTAVKQSEKDGALVVRGVNLLDQTVEVSLQALLPIREANLARLDETTVEPLAVEANRRVRFAARPHEIVTLRLRL